MLTDTAKQDLAYKNICEYLRIFLIDTTVRENACKLYACKLTEPTKRCKDLLFVNFTNIFVRKKSIEFSS